MDFEEDTSKDEDFSVEDVMRWLEESHPAEYRVLESHMGILADDNAMWMMQYQQLSKSEPWKNELCDSCVYASESKYSGPWMHCVLRNEDFDAGWTDAACPGWERK